MVEEAVHCALSLAQGGDTDAAAELLRCECQAAPAATVAPAYQALIEAYLREERLDSAFEVVMRGYSEAGGAGGDSACVVPVGSQEALLRAMSHAQQHRRAVEVLRAMCNAGLIPGDTIFNGVVDASVRSRAYSEAWDVLELLLSHRRRADKYFVSILTKSLESSSDRRWVRRGITLVDQFIERQQDDVDEIVFNSLLNVLGQIGDMQKLAQTLAKMAEYRVAPSAVTYGTVVKAYGRARDIEAVLKVWQEMRSRCLGVNPVTCGCVLDACVKCGHLDKAMAIFQEMRLSGLHRNTVLYATLIKGLAKVRNLMGAVHLYAEMRMEAVPCNLVTFNSLIDVCVRCGDLQTAALFVKDMIEVGIEPDLITFSTLIKGYSHIGDVNKALALKNQLMLRGLKCDEIMYNSLIDCCAKANSLQHGLSVFDDMLRSRVAPSNITFSILVKLHFEAGLVDEAFLLVEKMLSVYQCPPSRIVYTVLFRCCEKVGGPALGRAAALLEDLARKRSAKVLDQVLVGTVVTACARHAKLDMAMRLVQNFAGACARRSSGSGSNLVPFDSLRALGEALGAHRDERGEELIELLQASAYSAAQLAQVRAAYAEGLRLGPRSSTASDDKEVVAESPQGPSVLNPAAAPCSEEHVQAHEAPLAPESRTTGDCHWPAQHPYMAEADCQAYSNDFCMNAYLPAFQQQHLMQQQMGYYGEFNLWGYSGSGLEDFPSELAAAPAATEAPETEPLRYVGKENAAPAPVKRMKENRDENVEPAAPLKPRPGQAPKLAEKRQLRPGARLI